MEKREELAVAALIVFIALLCVGTGYVLSYVLDQGTPAVKECKEQLQFCEEMLNSKSLINLAIAPFSATNMTVTT
jgi:hypothetical protein